MRILTLIRPQQWLKNLFVFLPLFFDRKLFAGEYFLPVLIAFAAFCMLSGAVYCFNDIRDVAADRMHPRKRLRPIASGAVSTTAAYAVMCVCAAVGIVLLLLLPAFTLWVGVLYLAINLLYSLGLKRVALVDTFVVAVGFVIRIFAGGFAAGLFVSHWIVMMTFLLALFLALAKRRDDVVIYTETGVVTRGHIVKYNVAFLDMALTLISAVIVICYILYTVSPDVVERIGSPYLYTTAVIVLLGLLRYMQITVVDRRSGSPTAVLMHDRFIQVCVVLWIAWYAVILYL